MPNDKKVHIFGGLTTEEATFEEPIKSTTEEGHRLLTNPDTMRSALVLDSLVEVLGTRDAEVLLNELGIALTALVEWSIPKPSERGIDGSTMFMQSKSADRTVVVTVDIYEKPTGELQ